MLLLTDTIQVVNSTIKDNPNEKLAEVISNLERLSNISLFGVRSSVFYPIVDQLATITTPTLIIWGKQDRILPVAHAYVAAKGLPNARLHIFDPCGHHPHLERPTEFNALVLEFLAD